MDHIMQENLAVIFSSKGVDMVHKMGQDGLLSCVKTISIIDSVRMGEKSSR
jgi:hypothetical protein